MPGHDLGHRPIQGVKTPLTDLNLQKKVAMGKMAAQGVSELVNSLKVREAVSTLRPSGKHCVGE